MVRGVLMMQLHSTRRLAESPWHEPYYWFLQRREMHPVSTCTFVAPLEKQTPRLLLARARHPRSNPLLTIPKDPGQHTLGGVLTKEFLEFSKEQGEQLVLLQFRRYTLCLLPYCNA